MEMRFERSPQGGLTWIIDDLVAILAIMLPFSTFLGPANDPHRLYFVAGSCATLCFYGWKRGIYGRLPESLIISLLFGALAVSVVFIYSGDNYFINYEIGAITGLHAAAVPKRSLRRAALAVLAVQISIQSYEFLTGHFVFTTVSQYGDVYDEKVYGGSEGVFRSKGLSDGPTSLGATYIYLSLLFRETPVIQAICLIGSYFASARLAIIAICGIVLLDICRFIYSRLENLALVFSIFSIILACAVFAFEKISEQQNFDFVSVALTINSENNLARAYYINQGLEYIRSMTLTELLIGTSHDLKENGTAFESAWITLTAQSGMVITGLFAWSLMRKSLLPLREIEPRVVIGLCGLVAGIFNQVGNCTLLFVLLGQSWMRYNEALPTWRESGLAGYRWLSGARLRS